MRKVQKVLLTCLCMSLLCAGCSSNNEQNQSKASQSDASAEQEEEIGLQFPCELEGGKLTVNSLFESDIMNPDCEDEIGEAIASLELINTSGEYIERAEVTVTLEDGTEIPFELSDLPAEKTIWVFAKNNQSTAAENPCVSISGNVIVSESENYLGSAVMCEAEGEELQATNLSEQRIANAVIVYHTVMDDIIFGGLSKEVEIEEIEAGETVEIETESSFMGIPEAVKVRIEEK